MVKKSEDDVEILNTIYPIGVSMELCASKLDKNLLRICEKLNSEEVFDSDWQWCRP